MAVLTDSYLNQIFERTSRLQLPVAIYRLPGKAEYEGIIQTSSGDRSTQKSGFVIAPAMGETDLPKLVISPDIVFSKTTIDATINKLQVLDNKLLKKEYLNLKNKPKEVDQATYFNQVENIKTNISTGRVRKAILSRIKSVELPDGFDISRAFLALAKQYPNVMVYLVNVPGVGIWLGATPEILIKEEDGLLETMSLAGTQANKGLPLSEVSWGAKEKDEQQIVTDHIRQCLQATFGDKMEEKGPFTVSTGPLLHLKTTFKVPVDGKAEDIPALLKKLHPTPAIVGEPRSAALQVIQEAEQHSRAYYTGYLGPMNMNGATHLFVNLRCMQIIGNTAYLYLGGGITADSDPEAEWEETELKAQTLLNVLQNM